MEQRSANRKVDLPAAASKRCTATLGRAVRRRCPYCGGHGVFSGWFTLKERCPHCRTLFAYEDGYFLGAYAINLFVTELFTVALVIWMIAGTDMSVLQMQIVGVALAVGLPIFFYPYAMMLWMVLDLVLHPPGTSSGRPRQ